VLSLLAGA